jgi:hypothetical protein
MDENIGLALPERYLELQFLLPNYKANITSEAIPTEKEIINLFHSKIISSSFICKQALIDLTKTPKQKTSRKQKYRILNTYANLLGEKTDAIIKKFQRNPQLSTKGNALQAPRLR